MKLNKNILLTPQESEDYNYGYAQG